jgi:hypothetical protein
VFGAFLVLVCNLVVSFNHTLALFRSGGFNDGLEYVAAVGVETTFIMGALNIVYARLKGISPGAPAVLGGLLGVALVGWSNVSAGWSYGLTGILLGLAIPSCLIVSEAILSREAILHSKRVENVEKETFQKVESVTEEETFQPVSALVSAAKETDQPEDAYQPASIPLGTVKDIGQPKETEQPKEIDQSEKSPTNKKVKDNVTVQKSEDINQSENEYQKALETALRIYEKEGKLVGRTRLARAANCSDYIARKAITQLKKQINETQKMDVLQAIK